MDTSVWIAHLRSPQKDLIALLKNRQALIHSCVIGELACGHIPNRQNFLADLNQLPQAIEATNGDCLAFLERRRCYGKGLGWVDVQLLASAALSNARVLSLDKALARYAESSI